MAESKYYNNLYPIVDDNRRIKYLELIIKSLEQDMNKWSKELSSKGYPMYYSCRYNESRFHVESRQYSDFCYIQHKNPIYGDVSIELISDNFSEKLNDLFKKLEKTVYTPDINEIGKMLDGGDRKSKLLSLELGQIKEMVDETYQDWIESESETSARIIARLIYSHRRKKEAYELWFDKFKDYQVIIDEIDKLGT